MTIIVAFILEAFVFRMNYSRKNQDSEGLCGQLRPTRPPLPARLAAPLSASWPSACPGLWQLS